MKRIVLIAIFMFFVAIASATPKIVLVKDYSYCDVPITLSKSGLSKDVVFKAGDSHPVHIRLDDNRSFSMNYILKGSIYSRAYIFNSLGMLAFINNDSLFILDLKNNLKKEIQGEPSDDPAWAPSGKQLAYFYENWILIYNILSQKKTFVTSGSALREVIWLDENCIAYIKDDHIFRYSFESKTEEQLTKEKALYKMLVKSICGKLYFSIGGRFKSIHEIDLKTKEMKEILLGDYRILGILEFNKEQQLTIVDPNKKRLFLYGINSKKQINLVEQDVFDGVVVVASNAVVFSTTDNKVYIYWL